MSEVQADAVISEPAPAVDPVEELARQEGAIHDEPPPSDPTNEASDASADAPPVEEVEDWEHEGKQYKVPKELKPMLMMHRDYTQKTQAAAEQVRQAQTMAQAIEQREAQIREELPLVSQIGAIEQRLQQFQQVNWSELEAQNPATAASLFREFQQLEKAHGQYLGVLQARMQQRDQQKVQAEEAAIQAGYAKLQREIKNFSPELESKLLEEGLTRGFTAAELRTAVARPELIKLLNDARIGREFLSRAGKKPEPSKLQPTTKLTPSAQPATRDMSRMSMKDFVALRQKQERTR